MSANEMAEAIVKIIKSEPNEIVSLIQNEDYDGLRDELYYRISSAAEDA